MHKIIQSIQEHETLTPHCIRITGMDCPVERMVLAAEFRRALPLFEVKVNPAYPALYIFPKLNKGDVHDSDMEPPTFIEHDFVHPQAAPWKYDYPFFIVIVAAFIGLHFPLPALPINIMATLLTIAAFVRFRPQNLAWHFRGLRLGWPTPQLLLWTAALLPTLSLPLHLIADTPATHALDGALILIAGYFLRQWQFAFFARHLEVGDPRGRGETIAPLAQFFAQALLWLCPMLAASAFALWMLPVAPILSGVMTGMLSLDFIVPVVLLLDYALQAASAMLLLPPVVAILLTVPTLYAACLRAAREHSIFCDSIQTLTMLDQTSILAMRRTGIITQAHPKVKEFVACAQMEEKEAVAIAAALEANAEYPYAGAIRAHAQRKWMELPTAEEAEETPSMGVSGMVNEQRYFLGGENYINTLGINTETARHAIYRLSRSGDVSIILADTDAVLGVFAISDPLLSNVVKLNKALLELGITPVLLSHRNREFAKTVADQSAAVKAFAEASPDDLAAALRLYQKERVGKTALMCLREPHKKLRACVDVIIVVKSQGKGVSTVSADVEVPSGLEDVLTLFNILRKKRNEFYFIMLFNALVFMNIGILAFLGVPAVIVLLISAATLSILHSATRRIIRAGISVSVKGDAS